MICSNDWSDLVEDALGKEIVSWRSDIDALDKDDIAQIIRDLQKIKTHNIFKRTDWSLSEFFKGKISSIIFDLERLRI